ncbi:MAG: thiamine diphosphokinase [Eubacterium sp.]|jgi:thiamine pyrophosphokinase|nr:thiamine diphosphokinase [Eubacterium sp.]
MDTPTCYIFGAGEFSPCEITLTKDDLVIAADGGYDHLVRLGLRADVALGDFDSVTSHEIWEDTICEKKAYPPEKDDTDMMLAIQFGLTKGYEQFAIFGGLGGRLDHTVANIQALSFLAANRAQGILYHEDYALTVIQNSSFTLSKDVSGYVSVFSLSDTSENVTIKGLKYEVEGVTLSNTVPLGVSNEAVGKKGVISVERGLLLILWHITASK